MGSCGVDRGRGRQHSRAGDGLSENFRVGGEVLDEVQALPVEANDGDGIAGLGGFQEGVNVGADQRVVGVMQLIKDDDGLGDGLGWRGLDREGVGREGWVRGAGWDGIGCELGDGSELLRHPVFKEGEGGGVETLDGVAVGVHDDNIEDDEAGGGADGGDVVACGLRNLCGGTLIGSRSRCEGLLRGQRWDGERKKREQEGRACRGHGGSGGGIAVGAMILLEEGIDLRTWRKNDL